MKTLKQTSRRRIAQILAAFFRNEDGANLVETGLAMIIYMSFFFAIIQFSYGLYVYNYVGEAAREGTRWAVVRGSECGRNMSASFCSPSAAKTTGAVGSDIQSYVQNLGFPGMNKSSVSVSSAWYTGSATKPRSWSACTAGGSTICNQPGNQVQVTVSYPVPIPIPFWKQLTLNVKSTSQMVIVE